MMEPVAIIGMECIFPGAPDLRSYWQNIVSGVDAIIEVPEHRWPRALFDPESREVDRFYCHRGGFIDEYAEFDPLEFGIMPKVIAAAEPDQLLALKVGAGALRDAGYLERDFPRERTAVILGRGGYAGDGTLRLQQHVRIVHQTLQTLQDVMPQLGGAVVEQIRRKLKAELPHFGPDVAAGVIPNLVASRLANRLDLRGPSYTVDAACASSLIAVEQACQSLTRGDVDMVLTGGLHLCHDLTFWATFCQLGALSRSQQIRPFSAEADGILAAEGVGLVVLKRLCDAQADGDRIYAVLQGVGSASDGRSSSLLAPSVDGQLLALQRAWQHTSFQPEQIGLLEAHGTATLAGDEAELETVRQFFGNANDGLRPVLGSVKSMIGHTMPAAGAAGLIKAALAVHHGVLPPTLHCERPHELLATTRFRVIDKQERWPSDQTGQRLAAVNAFGFGGINAHAVLSAPVDLAGTAMPRAGDGIPTVLIAAESQEALLRKLRARQWDRAVQPGSWRLAIVEPDDARIAFATKIVSTGKAWHGKNQIYFSGEQMLTVGKLALVFPGVDSSFDPQVEDVAAHFGLPRPRYATKLDPSKDLMQIGLGLTEVELLLFDALSALRIQAGAMAGHSIGEWCAMAASGMLSRQFVQDTMAWVKHEALPEVDLLFVTAACDETRARQALAGLDELTLSHDNCPHQVIFCGRKHDVETALRLLHEHHILAQILPFASGFHSPLFAPFITPYRDSFQRSQLQEPVVPLWSATTCQRYPLQLAAKRELAVEHLLKPVRFRQLVENLYADGYRAFVQVGTGSLVGFVQDTLSGRPHLAISANIAKRSGMQQLTHVCAALWVEGASFDVSLLGLREPTSHAAAKKSTGKKAPLQLSLGVPLLRVKMPMPMPMPMSVAVADLAPSRVGDDPLTETFAAVMADIQQAGNDVLTLWRQRQIAPALSHEPPSLPPAPPMASPASEDMPAPFDVRIIRHLDVDSTIPCVRDHSFIRERAGWPVLADRRPLVPLTMEIELLRAALEAQVPGHVVVAFNNIEAFRWLLVADPIDIALRLTLAEYPLVRVEIEGYLRGRAVLAKQFPAAPPKQNQPLQNARPCAITAQEMYRDNWMFHLDAYRGITNLGPLGDDGIDGVIEVPKGPGALLDNMGQLAGYWVMASQEHAPLAMPIGVQQVRFYGPQPAVGEVFACETRIRELDEQNCRSDLQLINDDGDVVVEMLSWHTRRYAMTQQFHERMRLIELRTLSTTFGRSFMVFEDRYDTALMREYLAVRVLNQPELADYEALPPRRKRQWLNGRIAAKDAVRGHLWSQYGKRALFPKELRISTAPSGQPLVQPHLTDAFTGKVHVSISHKDQFAVALADDRPVGIDIESIEQRSDSTIALAFTTQELALLPAGERDEWITRAWAAKEVISKIAGCGMQGKPLQFRLQAIAQHRLCVDDVWVDTLRYQNYVIAWGAAQ